MAFDWMESDVSAQWTALEASRARKSIEREMEDRARLLLRLGYTAEQAKLRVRGNLLWDFELHGRPAQAERADEIVDRVFARR